MSRADHTQGKMLARFNLSFNISDRLVSLALVFFFFQIIETAEVKTVLKGMVRALN